MLIASLAAMSKSPTRPSRIPKKLPATLLPVCVVEEMSYPETNCVFFVELAVVCFTRKADR
jgi:hypothetical protein